MDIIGSYAQMLGVLFEDLFHLPQVSDPPTPSRRRHAPPGLRLARCCRADFVLDVRSVMSRLMWPLV